MITKDLKEFDSDQIRPLSKYGSRSESDLIKSIQSCFYFGSGFVQNTKIESDSNNTPRSSRIRPKYPDPAGFVQNTQSQLDSTKIPRSSRIHPKYPDPAGYDQNTQIQPDSTKIPRFSRIRPKYPDPAGFVQNT